MFRWISIILMVFVATHSQAAEKEATETLPWHLADVWSVMKNDIEFERLYIDLEFGGVENKPDVNFFFVPLSLFINGTSCYAGFLTSPTINFRDKEREIHDIDSVRFTRLSRLSDSIVKAEGGYSFESDHEGEHASVWKEFPFKAGKYRLELETKPLKNGRILVKCFARPHGDKTATYIGGLEFPGKKAVLNTALCSFYEIAWRKTDGSSQLTQDELSKLVMPKAKFSLSHLTVDDVAIDPVSIKASHSFQAPQKAQVTFAGKKNDGFISLESSELEFSRKGFELEYGRRHAFQLTKPEIEPTVKFYVQYFKSEPKQEK